MDEKKDDIVHPITMTDKKKNPMGPVALFGGGILIIFLGITSGYLLASRGASTTTQSSATATQVVGNKDTKTFRDSAEGIIEEGGLDGEGTHKLLREGGDSQTVYLTSSVVDLGKFTGKKVRVWGETFAAAKAAWLMDVGRVELLE